MEHKGYMSSVQLFRRQFVHAFANNAHSALMGLFDKSHGVIKSLFKVCIHL